MTLTGIAKRVHDQIMACDTDEEAALYAAMVVGGALQHDMETHRPVLQQRVDQIVAKRAEVVRKSIVRSAVSKRLAGEEVGHLLAAAEVIAKAAPWDASREQKTKRDERGRFSTVESRRRIGYTTKKPLPPKHADALGIKPPKDDESGTKLKGADAARYQQAYAQIAQMTAPYSHMPINESVLALTIRDANGDRKTVLRDMPGPGARILDAKDFLDGSRVLEAAVLTNPTISSQGAAFDLVGALGGSSAGVMAGHMLQPNKGGGGYDRADEMGSFAREWNRPSPGDPRGGIYRRLGAGSRLLSQTLGPILPARARLALDTANFVGEYGAQAEKVIGPHADRTAYRYRGIERTPEPGLQSVINSYRRRYPNPNEARAAIIYGPTGDDTTGRGKPGVSRSTGEREPSRVIEYFRSRLANPDLLDLQAKSGVIPPSEGIIIDRSGKVVTQAVGYGDDWYLPFNLKNLTKLKGGEYIRTRAWGGPTTEDIYTGLVSGARAVTVISHNGVYTVEFDPTFRGSRRYSDKAARMVKRYGHLLDAAKSKEVTLSGIPENRLEELRAEVGRRYGIDPRYDRKAFNTRFEELKTEERQDPQMAEADKRALAIEFIEENLVSDTGETETWIDVAGRMANRDVARMRAGTPAEEGFDETGARQMAMARYDDPFKVIGALGPSTGDRWVKTLKAAEDEYRAAQRPLNLDGAGYARSLDALKEQFPYYIQNVHFQPKKMGTSDIGYVKPRYTRPAGVLSGYFDASIEGRSKVTADQTRWQAGHDPAKAQVWQSREKPGDKDGGTLGSAPGSGPDKPAAPGTDAARALREQSSVTALWKDLKTREIFDGGPQEGKQVSLAMGELRRHFPTIYGKTEDEFARAYRADPTRTKRQLLAEAERLKERGFFDVRTELVDAVRDPQQQVKGQKWDLLEAFGNPNATFDFGEAYGPPGPGRDPDFYESQGERMLGTITDLRATFQDSDLEDKLTAYIGRKRDLYLTVAEKPAGYQDALPGIERDVQRAVQTRQLLRRFKQAQKVADKGVQGEAAAAQANRPIVLAIRPDQAKDMGLGNLGLGELLEDPNSPEARRKLGMT